jgi:hypothetical protein
MFFKCLSDRVFNILQNDKTLQFLNLGDKSQEYLDLFIEILTIFDGESFPIHQLIQSKKFSYFLFEISKDFQIQPFYSIILECHSIPSSIESSLYFVQQTWSSLTSHHHNTAINIIASNFKHFSVDQIKLIPIPIFDQILSSPNLQIGTESFLFDLLFQFFPTPTKFNLPYEICVFPCCNFKFSFFFFW